MSDQPRDWDKEMAEIDRIMGKPPAISPGSAVPVARGPASVARSGGGRFAASTTWLRVGLGLLLAVGMTQWPYPNACGINLAIYLGAILTVAAAGLWSSVTSWRRQMGLAHALSLMVLLWGLILVAREVLPRVGYAAVTRTWVCP